MTSHFLLAIFGQATSNPIVPKTAAWKAAALATGLGIAMLAYPAYAATDLDDRHCIPPITARLR